MQETISHLLRAELIRGNLTIHYNIRRSEPGRLTVEETVSFDVVNLTGGPVDYRHYIALEKHDRPTIHRLECNSSDGAACYVLTGTQIESHDKWDEPGVIEAHGKAASRDGLF